MTMRHDVIYRHVQAGRPPTEHQTLVGFPMEMAIYRHVKDVEGYIDLKDVHIPPSGGCFTVILQLTPHYEGQAKNALMAALSSPYIQPKIAVAVDEDIDIYDPSDVQWAVSTRVNPSKDVFIVDGARNYPMDPPLDQPAGDEVTEGGVEDEDRRNKAPDITARGEGHLREGEADGLDEVQARGLHLAES
jgi:2,5-furandicarboxylate decarboxylase 1